MNIKLAVTSQKIGTFLLKDNHANKLQMNYEADNLLLKSNVPRIYLITKDSIIKKIGGSAAKGGIKATMSFYLTAMTGAPGKSRFVVHLLIEKALLARSVVEVHMITSPMVDALVSGLFKRHSCKVASFKESESICKHDYFSSEGRYPDWNFQENHEEYPSILIKKYNEYDQQRLAK